VAGGPLVNKLRLGRQHFQTTCACDGGFNLLVVLVKESLQLWGIERWLSTINFAQGQADYPTDYVHPFLMWAVPISHEFDDCCRKLWTGYKFASTFCDSQFHFFSEKVLATHRAWEQASAVGRRNQ